MSNSRGALAQPAGVDAQLYIINLISTNTPMSLEAPDLPELGGFAVFRSRRMEDGRDRFRLHLGYFDSQEQAEKFLPLLRDRYPAAWVALAPQENMGSLDDTSVAQFKFIPLRKSDAAAAARTKQSAAPAANLSASAQTPAEPKASNANTKTVPAAEFLQAADVLTLLESAPRTLPSAEEAKPVPRAAVAKTPVPAAPVVARVAQPAPAQAAAKTVTVPTLQSFAVQLIWSPERPDTSEIPRLAIFDAYTMYTVTVQRAGRVWYGLRLGFFNDPVSAKQVALYVRSDFAAASVVPVSERECGRAEEAAKVVIQKEAAVRQQQRTEVAPAVSQPQIQPAVVEPDQPLTLSDMEPIKKAPEAVSAQEQFRKSLETLERPLEASPRIRPKPPQSKKGAATPRGTKKGNPSTTEELMQELGAHAMSLEDEEGHTFTDTGVRHLSVAVIKPKSKLGKLFGKNR